VPRPELREITFTIDGRDVQASEGAMLVDAAKHGDVEIPVFCYEPKLGQPVGACRMCLVEIEGIPKLQAGCATPVKDGMVVHTQTARVKAAQESVLEFLLINHPLDCPVCDKGGECPLQDISFGWGGGKTRYVEPKRHFEKPLALSPLIAIDRERCILCYRCVRFSQEVSEDYQLILHERGTDTYVGTFDGHPYVAPFSGNIIELCPVGALTSRPYRFRARPWDIEQAGSICTLCPAQCNVSFTVRDERVLRVLQRQNDAVDDGWLCDRGRFAYQALHVDERITAPLVRDGGVLREVSWERALGEAASALGRMKGHVGALAGGGVSNEEGFLLQRLLREGLSSGDIDTAGAPPPDVLQRLYDPALGATVADLEFAHTVLVLGTEPVDALPILDLRIRKGVRRRRVNLAVATARPSSLDPNAKLSLRYAPGGEAAFVTALTAAVFGGEVDAAAAAAGVEAEAVRALASLLRTGGEDVVVLVGGALLHGGAVAPLLKLLRGLNVSGRDGAGVIVVPEAANGRGLAEVGVLPGVGPGFASDVPAGRDAAGIAQALIDGELTALYLAHVDPLRDLPDSPRWEAALERASTVIAHASLLTAGLREHATVVFPAESHAEKEGTVTHPDGRLQRLRRAIGRQGDIRSEWSIYADLCKAVGLDSGALTASMVTRQLAAAVPFYAGIDADEIGGTGVRWQDRAAAGAFPTLDPDTSDAGAYVAAASPNGALRLGTFRSIWAAPEVEVSPALKFLVPKQRAELAPADARRLGLGHGEKVVLGSDGQTIEAVVHLRDAAPAGTVFVESGIAAQAANALEGPLVEIRKA
jgi:NADH-quinone oxidoreductase subunit G